MRTKQAVSGKKHEKSETVSFLPARIQASNQDIFSAILHYSQFNYYINLF